MGKPATHDALCVQHALITVRPLLPSPLLLPAGLLTSGLIPSVRHAMDGLLTSDAILLPASTTVYMQAVRRGIAVQQPSCCCDPLCSTVCTLHCVHVPIMYAASTQPILSNPTVQVELRTEEVCGLKMSAANLYRWHPAYATGEGACPATGPALLQPIDWPGCCSCRIGCSSCTKQHCASHWLCRLQACPWHPIASSRYPSQRRYELIGAAMSFTPPWHALRSFTCMHAQRTSIACAHKQAATPRWRAALQALLHRLAPTCALPSAGVVL